MEIALQYDAWDRSGTLDGRYKKAPAHRCGELPRRRRLVWTLPDARFSNRQNGGSDFRLSVRGADLEILGVKVRRLDKTELERPALRVED
ncbi:MAG: hypothetical protein R3F20_04940 [Planctomycetota bacterium]